MTKYLLHIDTATDAGTVAISGDGLLLAYRINEESRNHAATINNMIADVLADVNKTFDDLCSIVVCGGPGSYTGLRIGMATAKGLCYALDKPLLLDNRLTLLAYHGYKQRKNCTQYISLLMAREKEYFISVYDKDFVCIVQPQHIMEDQLQDLVERKDNSYIISNAPETVINNLMVNNLQIDTDVKTDLVSWCFYAFEQYKCNNTVNLATAEPFYLKQVYTHK
jgi:tRNA threonylcarbamoyladenosine biosynthesis protein TsaB